MSIPEPIARVVAPLVNVNEPEAQVVEVRAAAFSPIAAGDVVCELETSKGTVEVEAEDDGFTGPIRVAEGQRVTAGDVLCEIYDEMPDANAAAAAAPVVAAPPAGGPRLSRKAQALAEREGLDISSLTSDRILTERDIEAILAEQRPVEITPEVRQACSRENAVVVFGAGGHAKSLIDVLRSMSDLVPVCFVDDGIPAGTLVMDLPVVGGKAALGVLAEAGARLAINGVGGLGSPATRARVEGHLRDAGFTLPAVIDASAAVAPSARIEPGAQVFAAAAIWSDAVVHEGAIINTGAIVSHDCVVGAQAHITPGAVLAGHVEVGEKTLVGMAVTTVPHLRIGAGAVVGNGAVLSADVPDGTIVAAGTRWTGV